MDLTNIDLVLRNIVTKVTPYRVRWFFRNPKKSINDLLTDIKSIAGYYKYRNRILLVVGLPKSGTTWVENFLYYVHGYCYRPLSGDRRKIVKNILPEEAFSNAPKKCYSFCKTHIHPTKGNIKILQDAGINKVLLMFRDPRDVVISRYFFCLERPEKAWEIGACDYAKISEIEGLEHSLDMVIDHYLSWISGWLDEAKQYPDNYYIVKYENLRRDPDAVFSEISNFFSLSLTSYQITEILNKLKSERQKNRVGGPVGKNTTFRKGLVGDWRNYFTTEMVQKFKQESGNILIQLGYEQNYNWDD